MLSVEGNTGLRTVEIMCRPSVVIVVASIIWGLSSQEESSGNSTSENSQQHKLR